MPRRAAVGSSLLATVCVYRSRILCGHWDKVLLEVPLLHPSLGAAFLGSAI